MIDRGIVSSIDSCDNSSSSSSVVSSIKNISSQLSTFTHLPGYHSETVSTVKREFMLMFLIIHCRLILIIIVST